MNTHRANGGCAFSEGSSCITLQSTLVVLSDSLRARGVDEPDAARWAASPSQRHAPTIAPMPSTTEPTQDVSMRPGGGTPAPRL